MNHSPAEPMSCRTEAPTTTSGAEAFAIRTAVPPWPSRSGARWVGGPSHREGGRLRARIGDARYVDGRTSCTASPAYVRSDTLPRQEDRLFRAAGTQGP